MLSYKEYKLLNESLYGAFNLGLRSQNTVGGIVSQSGTNGTEAAIEAQSEEAIEEAKKMKKKMEDEEAPEEDVEEKEGEEDSEEEDSEEKENDDDADGEEEDSDEEEEGDEDEPKFMKKKAKKEWSEIVSDLEAILEDISDDGAIAEIKKGLETIKEGMKKGCGDKMMDKKFGKMMDKKCGKYMSESKKGHKSDCDCPVCEKKDEKKDEKDADEGLTAAQKKLPKALQDAILAKKGKGEKKAEKKMNEEELAWWQSVHSMIGVQDQKGWDGGWSEIKDVATSLRDEERPV